MKKSQSKKKILNKKIKIVGEDVESDVSLEDVKEGKPISKTPKGASKKTPKFAEVKSTKINDSVDIKSLGMEADAWMPF